MYRNIEHGADNRNCPQVIEPFSRLESIESIESFFEELDDPVTLDDFQDIFEESYNVFGGSYFWDRYLKHKKDLPFVDILDQDDELGYDIDYSVSDNLLDFYFNLEDEEESELKFDREGSPNVFEGVTIQFPVSEEKEEPFDLEERLVA